jgi:hypothetical protein
VDGKAAAAGFSTPVKLLWIVRPATGSRTKGDVMRKIVSATVSAALALASATPALAQDYRYSGFDAPRGATATANLRVPLGREAKAKPSYGLTFGYGKSTGAALDGRTMTREVRLADIRFSPDGRMKQANVASFDLANLDRDRRLNLMGGGGMTWLIVGALAAGVGICLLSDCLGDGPDSEPAAN